MKEMALLILGLFSGAILAWFRFKYIWVDQRLVEQKLKTLNEAAKALALFEREALDPEIQGKKRVNDLGQTGATSRTIKLSAETDVLMRTALVKTKALYTENTYQCLLAAFRIQLDVKVPNDEAHNNFIKRSEKAVEEMSKDIKANISNLSSLTWRLHKGRS
ncbi:MAG: hypothetical protein U5L07_00785 [Desulfobacterales bacterium]|nr:hypothetical protein [Desulfobacterales bacterium]